MSDSAGERITALIEHAPNARERTVASQWVELTSDQNWTSQRGRVPSVTPTVRPCGPRTNAPPCARSSSFCAMSLLDSAGLLVPAQLDMSILLTTDGITSGLRQQARVVTTISDSWSGLTSAGVSTVWTAESAVMTETTPTLAEPNIPVHKLAAWLTFSLELGADAVGGVVGLISELGVLLRDAATIVVEDAYCVGTGIGQPTGLITALVGTPSVVAPTTAAAFARADVRKLQAALAPRWQSNASWVMSLPTIGAIASFETTAGSQAFPSIDNAPPSLLHRRVVEVWSMRGADEINTAATSPNRIAVYGDCKQFVVVDKLGSTRAFVPHVFDQATGRPSWQRGLILPASYG